MQIQKKLLADYNIDRIMAVFKDFSNEYIFDAKSAIRRIKPPMCDKCNSQMVHNGYNEFLFQICS